MYILDSLEELEQLFSDPTDMDCAGPAGQKENGSADITEGKRVKKKKKDEDFVRVPFIERTVTVYYLVICME